jgi:hypothetical protein
MVSGLSLLLRIRRRYIGERMIPVDDELRGFGENMAKMLCAVALGMVPFLTLMIDDQMEQLFAGIRCLCVCNGEVRLYGEGAAKRVACRNFRYSRIKASLSFLFLIDHHLATGNGEGLRGGAARGEGYP